MTVLKLLNFTSEPALLNKFKNNQSMQQIAQEAAQQTSSGLTQSNPLQEPVKQDSQSEKSENHTVRNWSIGLGAAAVLISLGILGRGGHLGKGLQKFLGGAEKKSGEVADEMSGKLDDIADEITHTTETSANKANDAAGEIKSQTEAAEIVSAEETKNAAKMTSEECEQLCAKINAQLDRTIPEVTAPLHIDIPKLPENLDELKAMATEPGLSIINKDGVQWCITRNAHGKLDSIMSDKYLVLFNSDEEVLLNTFRPEKISVTYSQGNKINNITKKIDNNIWNYGNNGELQFLRQEYGTDKKITKISWISAEGKIKAVGHIDKSKKIKIKEDFYDSNNNLIGENFYDDNGNILKRVVY